MPGEDNKSDEEKRVSKSDRREGDRRQGEAVTVKAMFEAYGFEEERVEKDPRSGKDRREDS